jgi:hypothetical protein
VRMVIVPAGVLSQRGGSNNLFWRFLLLHLDLP